MTFLDLFAGIGGFRKGMEMAGHKCIGFCEYDKFAVASYTSMHLITDEQREYLSTLTQKKRQKEILKEEYRNGEWYAKDIREVTGENIPKADCWCFGAPCQDFSIAGLRAGLDGDRSSLVHEVFRILGEIKEEDRPKWIIYENVKGMLSSNKGFDFLAILLEMDRCGYDVQWQLLNSKYHGVPQNRERVYTVGCLRGKCSSKIFPFEGTDSENSVYKLDVRTIGHRKSYNNNTVIVDPDGIARTLDTAGGGGRELHIPVDVMRDIAIPVLTPDRDKRQNGRRFKNNGEEAFTLTGQDRHGVAIGIDIEEKNNNNMFVIDKGVYSKEREIANCIESREDRGLSNHKQEGTLVCVKI